MADAKDFVPMI
jgi:hypothetical protein